MSILNKPIGLQQMATLLGVTSDIYAVCTSSKIKKNAKFKPVDHGSEAAYYSIQPRPNNTEITVVHDNPFAGGSEAMPYSVGKPTKTTTTFRYGSENLNVDIYRIGQLKVPVIHVSGKTRDQVAYIAISAINSFATNGLNWEPEALTGPKRLLDFDGYDTEAVPAYQYYVVSPLYAGQSLTANVQWKDIDNAFLLDSDALKAVLHAPNKTTESIFTPYVAFTDSYNFLISKSGFTNPQKLIQYDIDGNPINVNIGNGYNAVMPNGILNPFGPGTYKAFYFGWAESYNLILPLPSALADASSYMRMYNNPQPIQSSATPADWPWLKLVSRERYYGYPYNSPKKRFEFNSMAYMWTGYSPNGVVALFFDLINTGNTRITLNASKFRVYSDYCCGIQPAGGSPASSLYDVTSGATLLTGDFYIDPGEANKKKFCLKIDNFWKDTGSTTPYSPGSTETPEPYVQYYDNTSAKWLTIPQIEFGFTYLTPTNTSANWGTERTNW